MNSLIEFLKQSASYKGNPSSMRIMTYWVVFLFSIALTCGYVVVFYYHPEMILAYAGIIVGAMMTLILGKSFQSLQEAKNQIPTNDATPTNNNEEVK